MLVIRIHYLDHFRWSRDWSYKGNCIRVYNEYITSALIEALISASLSLWIVPPSTKNCTPVITLREFFLLRRMFLISGWSKFIRLENNWKYMLENSWFWNPLK